MFNEMTILFKPARILFNPSPIAAAARTRRVMPTAGASMALTCMFNPLRILFNPAASREVSGSAAGAVSNPRPGFVIP
ncbi:hypothetical protein [Salinispora arenicola]|uniref:hypothetical protein n=1 Tax=Salinispora arenicola TaxID=168697 RepID=UPI0012BB4B3C|nr:hypothetical protein [Salinispora arenicola]